MRNIIKIFFTFVNMYEITRRWRLTKSERVILKRKDNKYPLSKIAWVYYIIEYGKVIYIGCSSYPITRVSSHRGSLNGPQQYHLKSKFKGPFEYSIALKKEKAAIKRHRDHSNLKNKHANRTHIQKWKKN